MVHNNYDDVGYHYMVHPNGKIYEGREIIYKGSHVRLLNSRKIGILMMGDFDEQWWDIDDTLSDAHINTLNSLIKTLKSKFNLTKLGGHKEFITGQGYTCPGNLIMSKMDGLRTFHGLSKP